MDYDIQITVSTDTASYLLGGLAQAYRVIPASAPDKVSIDIKHTIRVILSQLKEQGVDLTNTKSPFNSYAKLIKFEQWAIY